MEFFINELSLHGQFYTNEAFADSVKTFLAVIDRIGSEIKENKLYKDSLFVKQTAIKNEHFLASLNRIKNPNISEVFIRLIFNTVKPKDWREEQIHDKETIYRCPDFNDTIVTDTSVAESAERKIANPETEKILINFTSSQFEKRSGSKIPVIKEVQPLVNIGVPCIEKKEQLLQFIVSEPLIRYLLNPEQFRKTTLIVQGCSVYEEIKTRQFWYLDNLHKNHFEIFDRNKMHLGEADLEGRLLPGTRDPEKDNKIDL